MSLRLVEDENNGLIRRLISDGGRYRCTTQRFHYLLGTTACQQIFRLSHSQFLVTLP
jgi:Fe2+ or Zn2+ uptake regulation protein